MLAVEFLGEFLHVEAHLLVCDPRVDLRRLDVGVAEPFPRVKVVAKVCRALSLSARRGALARYGD